MTDEAPTPTPDPAPAGVPPKQRRGCFIALIVAILLILGGCLTLWVKSTEIGIYLIRRGIADQPWSEATRARANRLLDRYVEADEAGLIGEDDLEAMKPLTEGFREANDTDGISEEEAGPLLDQWEAWLEEAEKEP